MKLNCVFYPLLAGTLCAILLSCGKEKTADEEFSSTFKVEKRLLTVGVDGGTLNFDYSISGPREGNVADVSSDSDWLKVGMIFNSSFSFTVDANDTGDDREATMTMTCSGVKPMKIVVMQSRKKDDTPIFSNYEILVSDVTTSSARFRITPVDAGKTYLYAVVRKSDFDGMSATAYIEARISQIKKMIAMYPGSTFSSFLSKGPVDTDNLAANQRPSLYDRTDYYVTAFDLSFDEATGTAAYSGNIDKTAFRSLSAPASKMNLQLVHKGDFVTVTTDMTDGYVCHVMSKDAWAEFAHPDDAAHLYVLTLTQYDKLVIHSGTYQMNLEDEGLVKGEKYVAYAVGYRDSATDGGLTTDVKFIEFTY